MNRLEISAIASSLVSSALAIAMLYLGLVYSWGVSDKDGLWVYWMVWEQTGTLWALFGLSVMGVATATAAAWHVGQARREAEAAASDSTLIGRGSRAATGTAGVVSWGADAHEAAMTNEAGRQRLVRYLVERKLAAGVAAVAAAALGFAIFANLSERVAEAPSTVELEILRSQRNFPDFPNLANRQRTAGVMCLVLGAISLATMWGLGKVGAAPGGAALRSEAAYHKLRALAFVAAGSILIGDTVNVLPEGSYYRMFRWTSLLPPMLLWAAMGGGRWQLVLTIGLFDDIVIAGIAERSAGDEPWLPVVFWVIAGGMIWQVLELFWNVWTRRELPGEGFLPLPSAEGQGLAAFAEGRGLNWLTEGLQTNFGVEIAVADARRFTNEQLLGTLLATGLLFCAATCVTVVSPWEVGLRERFGMLETKVAPVLVDPQGRVTNDVFAAVSPDGRKAWSISRTNGHRELYSDRQLEQQGYRIEERETTELLRPGWHFKWPWPIERVITVPVQTVEEITYGNTGHTHDELLMWSAEHYDNEFEIVTGDKSLLSVVATAHYRISDPVAYYRYVYPEGGAAEANDSHAGDEEIKTAAADAYVDPLKKDRGPRHGPKALMAQVGYRALTEVVSQNSIWALIAENRGLAPPGARADLETEVLRRTQERLDALDAGIQVLRVMLTDVHPPVKEETALRFELVLAAIENREKTINEARATVNKELSSTKARANQIISEALSDRLAQTRRAEGFAGGFREVAEVSGVVGPAGASLIQDRLVAQSRVRMLDRRQLIVLPPDLRFRVLMQDRRTLEDVIAPPPNPEPTATPVN